MNKNLLIGLAIIVLVALGYFALKNGENDVLNPMPALEMEDMTESGLELVQDDVKIKFNEPFAINDEWKVKVVQFEPNAKINGPGIIASDSDEELNPAIKMNFYKNDELIHYQICFKEMPGFHSVKEGQEYIIDLMDYEGFKKVSNGNYTIDSITAKVWRIK